jgi:anti-sigma factor RsiW
MNDHQENQNLSCEEIVELINELLDGDADQERLNRARVLIAANPQCAALHATLLKTIELFRLQNKNPNPDILINWP